MSLLQPPTVPASTVAQTNQFQTACLVQIYGGTVTAVVVGGVTSGLTAGLFLVPPDVSIAITYSVVPSWQWYAIA